MPNKHSPDFIQKHFGVNYNVDSRRCYWEALRRQPQWLFRPGVARHFAGTLMGRGCYEQVKRLLGRGRSVAPATACAGRIG